MTLSGNSLRQTVHTHRAYVHQAAKLVATLLIEYGLPLLFLYKFTVIAATSLCISADYVHAIMYRIGQKRTVFESL